MRIGLLTTGFPRRHGDVAGHFVGGFARALCARGHEVEVLAPEPAEASDPEQVDGLSVRFVPYARPRSWSKTFYGAGAPDNLRHSLRARLGAPAFVAALAAHAGLRRRRWDAVVSHWALPCGVVGSALGLPHLCVVHSADMHLLRRLPLRAKIAQQVAGPGTRMWFVAAHLREHFLALLPPADAARVAAECHTGPMGIDVPAAPAGARPQDDGVLSVLSMSRLVPIKGLDLLIRAIAGRRDLRLMLAGEGPERARLETLATGLDAPVRWLGHVSGARKARLLASADLFALPSRVLPSGRSEGLPTALLEAMAAGLPVVAARCGGVPDVVEHGRHGYLFSPGDVGGLSQAIDAAAQDGHLRRAMGVAAAERASAYTWPSLAARIDGLLSAAGRGPLTS